MNKFKYIVRADHPILRRVDRRCITAEEAKNIADSLAAIGYEGVIEEINEYSSDYTLNGGVTPWFCKMMLLYPCSV